jgi:hypothetical protein
MQRRVDLQDTANVRLSQVSNFVTQPCTAMLPEREGDIPAPDPHS